MDKILLCENSREVRDYLRTALHCAGHDVDTASDGQEVIERLKESHDDVGLVLLDTEFSSCGGIEVLRKIREYSTELPVIMMSSESSPQRVIEAMRSGATDFLRTPISPDGLSDSISKVLGVGSRPVASDYMTAPGFGEGFYVGRDAMGKVRDMIARIGDSDIPVLIQGETGSGKEVVARQLHSQTRRSLRPLLKLNCAALPSELVESELFGYERGAFTGAFQRKAGMFEVANGGTIFLDEIGDMDYKLQAKLLQVLQDKQFQRLGGKETVHVDVRVIAATHRDLDRAIDKGKFREDLLYRLNVVTIVVPPLRERPNDIIPLAELLLRRHCGAGRSMIRIPADLRLALLEHDWPGNVRELENVMQRYLLLRDSAMLIEDLKTRARRRIYGSNDTQAAATRNSPQAAPLENLERAKQDSEREVILRTLESTRWNRKQAARKLGIKYKALLYKMNKLAIEEIADIPVPQPVLVRSAAG